jgi:ferrochelatase
MNMLQQPDQASAMKPESALAHAPADHPKVTFGKIGYPAGQSRHAGSLQLLAHAPVPERVPVGQAGDRLQPVDLAAAVAAGDPDQAPFSSGAAYKSIWNEDRNESPLMTITKDQTAKMKARLEEAYGDKVVVDFCMRYGNPSTKSKVDELVAQGCTKILFFPLYPQYAGATSATACDEFFRALQNIKWQPIARTVEPYYEHPLYIEALAQSSSAPMPGWKTGPMSWWPATTACRSAT